MIKFFFKLRVRKSENKFMRCQSHNKSRFIKRLAHSSCLLIALIALSFIDQPQAQASCLLSYDNAQVLAQGDGLARLSFQGGQEGLGSHLEGRLGLPGTRELYLRSGACERNALWGWAIEAGVNQQFLTAEDNGYVDLAFRFGMVALLADNDQSEYTEMGFQPSLIVSYPFSVSKGRKGFVSLGLGLSAYFTDQKNYQVRQEADDTIEEIALESSLEWAPLVSVASAVDIIPKLPLALELRWQQGGVYGGASVAYSF